LIHFFFWIRNRMKLNKTFIFENILVQTMSIIENIVFQKIVFFKEFCLKMKKCLPIKCVLFLHFTHKKNMVYVNSEKGPISVPGYMTFTQPYISFQKLFSSTDSSYCSCYMLTKPYYPFFLPFIFFHRQTFVIALIISKNSK
jgi:hypothetical protein